VSATLVRAVLSRSRAEHAARLVLLVLAERARPDGVCWPSQKCISEEARLGERTVREGIEDLVALGELEVRAAQDGRRRLSVYRVLVGDLEPVDYERIHGTIAEPFGGPAPTVGHERQNPPVVESSGGRIHRRRNGVARVENRKKDPLPPSSAADAGLSIPSNNGRRLRVSPKSSRARGTNPRALVARERAATAVAYREAEAWVYADGRAQERGEVERYLEEHYPSLTGDQRQSLVSCHAALHEEAAA
jgi:Helix-turn-helix domain